MPAIDRSSNVVIYKFSKNEKWKLEEHSFPARMSTFSDIREYFGFTTKVLDNHILEVYRNDSKEYDYKKMSYKYAAEIDLFGDTGVLVFCDTFLDLIYLMKEVSVLTKFEDEDVNVTTELVNLVRNIKEYLYVMMKIRI